MKSKIEDSNDPEPSISSFGSEVRCPNKSQVLDDLVLEFETEDNPRVDLRRTLPIEHAGVSRQPVIGRNQAIRQRLREEARS